MPRSRRAAGDADLRGAARGPAPARGDRRLARAAAVALGFSRRARVRLPSAVQPAHRLREFRIGREAAGVDAADGTIRLRPRISSAKPIRREFGHACGRIFSSRSTIASSLSFGNACARIIVIAAVEREMPAWQWMRR